MTLKWKLMIYMCTLNWVNPSHLNKKFVGKRQKYCFQCNVY